MALGDSIHANHADARVYRDLRVISLLPVEAAPPAIRRGEQVSSSSDGFLVHSERGVTDVAVGHTSRPMYRD